MPAKKKTHYTITEAAKKLGITRQAVHKAIQRKLLQAKSGTFTEVVIRKARGLIITASSLENYRKNILSASHQERGKKTPEIG